MIKTGQRRVVVLRHGSPDNTTFAQVTFPAGVFDAPDADSVRATLTISPGTYGLTIEADAPIKAGVVLVFKYPLHFGSPAGARARYGTDAAFERALIVARLLNDGRVALLVSSRPASDNLLAVLPTGGTYVVGGLR